MLDSSIKQVNQLPNDHFNKHRKNAIDKLKFKANQIYEKNPIDFKEENESLKDEIQKLKTYDKSFALGINPLADMRKDFIDTFKPYKSWHHVRGDLFQPAHGVANIKMKNPC